MKCTYCGIGEMHPGTTTFTADRDGKTFVLRCVPADVCDVCGEAIFDLETVQVVECLHEEALESGVEVVVREFTAA